MALPIKRHPSLQPLSRDHHQALLLTWKIRQGIKKDVPAKRISAYCNWFFREHLLPHFSLEEQYAFPVLGEEDQLIQQALSEHAQLRAMFGNPLTSTSALEAAGDLLEAHIRFEERTLFNAIQKAATPEQLQKILEIHEDAAFCDNEEDMFWK